MKEPRLRSAARSWMSHVEGQDMRKYISAIFIATCLIFVLVSCSQAGDFVGINEFESGRLEMVDQVIAAYKSNYEYINIALVEGGEIVLTKSYGRNRLDKNDVYASVSKPVTAMILMQLYEGGLIDGLNEDIGKYDEEYANVLPKPYTDSEITFEQLLTHQSGVPHLSKLWKDGALVLDFEPGTGVQYSTNGFGILGEVMSEITGQSYPELVKTYIGEPVGADSFTSMPWFQAPGGQVRSTIEDMAKFAIGVMDETYVSRELLDELMFNHYADEAHGSLCLGWYCAYFGTEEFAIYHNGSNGRPRAFLAIKPDMGYAVAITGRSYSEDSAQNFPDLAIDLIGILKGTEERAGE
jgi:CubicO group peptidase (beta-lactamase class C family)